MFSCSFPKTDKTVFSCHFPKFDKARWGTTNGIIRWLRAYHSALYTILMKETEIRKLMLLKNVCIKREKIKNVWDFPGGPFVKTPCFQYSRCGFNPWLGNNIPTCCGARPKKEKKNVCIHKLEVRNYRKLCAWPADSKIFFFLMHCTTLSSMVGRRVNRAGFTYTDGNIKYYKCYSNSFSGGLRRGIG